MQPVCRVSVTVSTDTDGMIDVATHSHKVSRVGDNQLGFCLSECLLWLEAVQPLRVLAQCAAFIEIDERFNDARGPEKRFLDAATDLLATYMAQDVIDRRGED